MMATLLDNLPGMVYRCRNDRNWTMLFVSEASRQLTGYAPDELLGDRRVAYGDLIVAEDRAHVWEAVQAALQRERPFEITYRIATAAGEVKWVWERGRGILSADGALDAIEGFITDIGPLKRAETAAREHNYWFTLAFNQARDIMLLLRLEPGADGPAFRTISANARFLEAARKEGFAVTSEMLAGRTLGELRVIFRWPDEYWTQFTARCREVATTRRPLHFEESVPTPAGRYHGETTLTPVCDERGECGFLLYASTDVSERRRAEERLRESEMRFTELFEHTTDGVFSVRVTEDGRFIYEAFNPAAGRAAIIDPAAVRGREVREVFPPTIAAQFVANYRRCLAAGAPFGYEEEVGVPPRVRYFNTLLVPVKDATGRVVRIAGFARDVSESRQAEAARTALEAQLRQAQKLEAVGQLAAGVAHDFNNILAAIMLHLDLMRTQPGLPAALGTELEQLVQGARRGANLTRQLLLFSRKAVMRREAVDLNLLFTDLLKMLRRLIGEHVTIEFVPSPERAILLADAGMLEQVVMNLVVNARDAMPSGGRVTIAVTHVDVLRERLRNEHAAPGRYVCLRVTDTGTGMSPEVIQRIWEPFFTTKGPDKGTGLGLPTIFGIAQEHGGWIEVESQVGVGSTFSVLLPAHRGAIEPRRTRGPYPRAAGGRESVLIAEDDRDLRVATALILRNHGYQVFEAPDEPSAGAILAQPELHVDLVLADIALPGGIFGRQLGGDLQRRARPPRIILMSGFNSDIQPPTNLGTHHYLPKPFDSSRLLRTVRDCLDGKAEVEE